MSKWLPPKSWWLTPSGGPYPNPSSFWTILMEAPLTSHLLGALVAPLALLPLGLRGFALWYASVLLMVLWQAFNVERLGWDRYPLPQMIWRILIGAVPLGIALLILY